MPMAVALIAPLLLQAASVAAAPPPTVVRFPAYERYKGIERYAPNRADYAAAIGDQRFVMEKIAYRSDGLEEFAYLYRPVFRARGPRRASPMSCTSSTSRGM